MSLWRAAILLAAVAALIGGTVVWQRQALRDAAAATYEAPAARTGTPGAAPLAPTATASAAGPLPAEPSDYREFTVWTRGLAASGRPDARETLRAIIESKRPVIQRIAAVKAIGAHVKPEDAALLRRGAIDANANIAVEAVRGLLRLGLEDEAVAHAIALAGKGVHALSPFLRPGDETAPAYHPRALEYCEAALRTDHLRVRIEAAGALLRIDEPRGLDELARRLDAATPEAHRLHAVEVLGRAKDLAAVRTLLERAATADASATVREKAAGHLAKTRNAGR